MALITPILFLLVFGLIDFGRFVYTYAAISNATREGARTVSLGPQNRSDCVAIQRVEAVGQAFPIKMDSRSVNGNIDANQTSDLQYATKGPSDPTTLAPGTAYVYIWPAMAQGPLPPDTAPNCDPPNSTLTRPPGPVEVEVVYKFTPLTPVISQILPGLTVKAISIVHTEY